MRTGRGHGAEASQPGPSFGTGVPPPDVVASARAAFRTRDAEATLARLVTDSLDDPSADASERSISFAGGGLGVVVCVLSGGSAERREMFIDVAPLESESALDPDNVEVQSHGQMPARAAVLSPGRWTLSPVPVGPVRITVTVGGSKVQTAWTRL